jgi:hypothetical protein
MPDLEVMDYLNILPIMPTVCSRLARMRLQENFVWKMKKSADGCSRSTSVS